MTPPPQILDQWSGFHGGGDAPATQTIGSTAAWTALWQQLGREPPRAFDPAHEMAVAIFLGQRRTGGYRVEIAGVRREVDQIVVSYREIPPPADAMVPQMLTSPWTVAVLSGPSRPVVFDDRARAEPANTQRPSGL